MSSVHELTEGYPVELWRDGENGRLVIRAKNEGGNNVTEVDLLELIQWCLSGPLPVGVKYGNDNRRNPACASLWTLLPSSSDVPDAS